MEAKQYLMIENPGEAPVEGLLLFGATTKDSSDEKTIGMFGSGTKHAVLTLLRRGYFPIIYSGTTKLEWSLKPILIGGSPHHEVLVSVNGAKPTPTGCTLAMGKSDWGDNISLSYREFVSNALDATDGNIDAITFALTAKPRASGGVTRVFIPFGAGMEYWRQWLPKWFLHWRIGADPFKAGAIPKLDPDSKAYFFRRGVLIRAVGEEHDGRSIWDYNFVNLNLDEARNSDYYAMKAAAAKAIGNEPRKLAKTLRAITQTPNLWESTFSSWDLLNESYSRTDEFKKAVDKEFDGGVFVTSQAEMQLCANLGKQAVIVPSSWGQALETYSSLTVSKVLSEDAREGREILEPTEEMLRLVKKWEDIIKSQNLFSKPAPVKAFRQHPNSNRGQMMGFCRFDDGVYFNIEYSGESLALTVIEELAHWHSGQKDFTRQFQEWLIRLMYATQLTTETGLTLEQVKQGEEMVALEAKQREMEANCYVLF